MKIIGKGQDYYDSVLAYGHDTHVLYKRHTRILSIVSPATAYLSELPRAYGNQYTSRRLIVGFCGKLYPCVELSPSFWDASNTLVHAYNVEGIETFLQSLSDKGKSLEDFQKPLKRKLYSWESKKFRREVFIKESLFEPIEHQELFFEYNVPSFILMTGSTGKDFKIKLNPILRTLGFQKVVPPYQAYQEIDMFLGGVLGSGNPPVATIDDEHMKTQKGFYEYSFKTLPTKRR